MQFYQIEGYFADKQWAEGNNNRRDKQERARSLALKAGAFNQHRKDTVYFFVVDMTETDITVGAIVDAGADVPALTAAFLKAVRLDLENIRFEEITLNSLCSFLRRADCADFIEDDDEVLERFGLSGLTRGPLYNLDYGENLLEDLGRKEVYANAEKLFVEETMRPELDRIYTAHTRKHIGGHPVHYMIQTDDRDTRRELCRLLLQALRANDRIQNKRYTFLNINPRQDFPGNVYECLYKSSGGGAVIVRYSPEQEEDGDHADAGLAFIEEFCRIVRKYRNRVLTVFCVPRECTAVKSLFYENLGNIGVVEVREDLLSSERAAAALRTMAAENGVRPDKKLMAKIEEDKWYLPPELRDLFDNWYDDKLKTSFYPQYRDIVTVTQKVAKAAPKGSAYSELEEMIGLDGAKRVIRQALDYYKAQKIFASKGMKSDHPAMHMVFTGNPGTAKTTVARLFARIMKENGLLSKGNLVEVGRSELVGRYVGWTATIVKKKFEEAKGGVLFIDEAYSLVDGTPGSFGEEAINTIVQEMENHRQDMVVIFAGYPEEMERFIQKNPGLRSRIAFHVPFEDYDTAALCRIAALIAKQKGLHFTEEATEKLAGIFEGARAEDDFGNGRYVRNVIERARMAQATRLLTMDIDAIGTDDIATICAADIEVPPKTARKKRLGFCA